MSRPIYYSARIRSRTVKKLLEEFNADASKTGIVRKWMGYVHPEAWRKATTSYALEKREALGMFLNQ